MLPQRQNLRNILLFSLLITQLIAYSQESFHNFGNVQIHDQGQVGFHTNVINDGTFDQNTGFAGFYNQNNSLTIAGTNRPIFFDMEIDVIDYLFLEVPVGVRNFQEYTNGRVLTPRNQINVSLDYINDAPYLGENDDRYVDGYSSINGQLDFSFPIGDDFRLRPMRIDAQAGNNTSRGAYFFENPNTPTTFSQPFDTNNFEPLLYGISIFEFWDLNGDTATTVTLTWDDNSNIPTLVNELSDLRVVGWDKNSQQWVNLGNINTTGDLNNGEITSDSILPDNYEIITFGSSNRILDGDIEIFTAVSPNGDGFNDTFVIQGLAQFPDNEISIYNRWGVLVYSQEKYHEVQNTAKGFTGVSAGRATIARDKQLPVGTYYYFLNIKGEKNKAGYIYLNR